MDDYISRDAARDAMTADNLIDRLDTLDDSYSKRYARAAIRVLELIPPADVRPVVFCKDCKWFNPVNSDWCCEFENGLICPCEDDFCSFGDRREGGTDG